jgi:hypothetical protein
MYFAQEFMPLNIAMIGAGALVILIIEIRAIASLGWRVGIFGVALAAAMIMSITLLAAIRPSLQGMLLTAMSLGLFVLAMMLAPRLRIEQRTIAAAMLTPAPAH